MMKVKLETRDGEHVGHTYIPPFKTLPDVLVWGDRTFRAHDAQHGAAIYRECFTVVIVEPVTE